MPELTGQWVAEAELLKHSISKQTIRTQLRPKWHPTRQERIRIVENKELVLEHSFGIALQIVVIPIRIVEWLLCGDNLLAQMLPDRLKYHVINNETIRPQCTTSTCVCLRQLEDTDFWPSDPRGNLIVSLLFQNPLTTKKFECKSTNVQVNLWVNGWHKNAVSLALATDGW